MRNKATKNTKSPENKHTPKDSLGITEIFEFDDEPPSEAEIKALHVHSPHDVTEELDPNYRLTPKRYFTRKYGIGEKDTNPQKPFIPTISPSENTLKVAVQEPEIRVVGFNVIQNSKVSQLTDPKETWTGKITREEKEKDKINKTNGNSLLQLLNVHRL